MRTTAITINKGYVGEATVTKNLAAAASPAGFNLVMLEMGLTRLRSSKSGK